MPFQQNSFFVKKCKCHILQILSPSAQPTPPSEHRLPIKIAISRADRKGNCGTVCAPNKGKLTRSFNMSSRGSKMTILVCYTSTNGPTRLNFTEWRKGAIDWVAHKSFHVLKKTQMQEHVKKRHRDFT